MPGRFRTHPARKTEKCGSVSFWMEHGSLFRTAETGCRAVAKAVFVPLSDLEDSYIKGKLRDYQTEKYTIPNIEDIPKYMATQRLTTSFKRL